MLPIMICSLFVVAIGAERYWSLNPAKVAPKTLLAQVWSWIKNNQLDGTRIRELKQSSPLGRILAAGLSNSKHGREVKIGRASCRERAWGAGVVVGVVEHSAGGEPAE